MTHPLVLLRRLRHHAGITESLRRLRHVTGGSRAALSLTRRNTLIGAAVLAVPGLASAATPAAFSAATVRDLAARLAAQPYAPAADAGPDATYDAWAQVQPLPRAARWTDGRPFHADLLPAGYIFRRPVEVFEVDGGVARPTPFDSADYRTPAGFTGVLQAFSGLRLQHQINTPGKFDEIAVFQGASYFRSVGQDQGYGASARGIALGPGQAGEEFPDFRAFWIERPQAGAEAVIVHALLDGPSVTGAYRFSIRPGRNTVFDVEATLFARRDIAELGLAPATSMFWFSPASSSRPDDFRPAVHDSDGLELWTADGGRVWRPLANPRRTQITRLPADGARGFGLMQRTRDVADFSDLEARYDRRPSLWVEPVGDWGAGSVVLVELPTRNEYADNIVAYWAPAAPLKAGQSRTWRYRLHWGGDPAAEPPLARAVQTRTGEAIPPGARQFAVDFQAPDAVPLAEARGEALATAGSAGPVVVHPHPEPGLVRASFRFEPPARGSADIDLRLVGQDGPLSETWRFRWTA
jgi:glucans biosynthesis protein